MDPISMKFLRGVLFVAAGVLGGLPAWAAIQMDEVVDRLPGVQSDDTACHWEKGMVLATIAKSRRAIAIAAAAPLPAGAGLKLSLQVTRLKLTRGSRSSEYSAVVRGDLVAGGKLLATRDFEADESFKNGQSGCDALQAIGASFGESVADWAVNTRLMRCGEGCAGIHPDETIVTGAQVLIGGVDAVNDTVRDQCHLPTAMVNQLVKAFNENDLPPRAKLESRPIDIERYPGRRLLLRVNEVHALGGGRLTGPKWMSISGELREGDLLVANFDAFNESGDGLTTCRSADSLVDSSADMIAEWLRSPTLDAKLK